MSRIIAIFIGIFASFLLSLGGWWYFKGRNRPDLPPNRLVQPTHPFGFYLVDGSKDGSLGIALGDPNKPVTELKRKRASAYNVTLNELKYVDPEGREWIAPKGTINDGASVPPVLESFIAGGLNTDARYAAILHDYYCDVLTDGGKQDGLTYPVVHRMFYHAMRCSGVEEERAILMYVGVMKFGPPQDRSLWLRVLAHSDPSSDTTLKMVENACAVWDWNKVIPPSKSGGGFIIGDSAVAWNEATSKYAQAMADSNRFSSESAEITQKMKEITGGIGLASAKNDDEAAARRERMESLAPIIEGLAERTAALDEQKKASDATVAAVVKKFEELKEAAKKDSAKASDFRALLEDIEKLPPGKRTLDTVDEMIGSAR